MITCVFNGTKCIIDDTIQHLLTHDSDCESQCMLGETCPTLIEYDNNQALSDAVNAVMTSGIQHVCTVSIPVPANVPAFSFNAPMNSAAPAFSFAASPGNYSMLSKATSSPSKPSRLTNAAHPDQTNQATGRGQANQRGNGRGRANQRGNGRGSMTGSGKYPTGTMLNDTDCCDAIVTGVFFMNVNGKNKAYRHAKCTEVPVYCIQVDGKYPRYSYRCEEHGREVLFLAKRKNGTACKLDGQQLDPNTFANNTSANEDSGDDSDEYSEESV